MRADIARLGSLQAAGTDGAKPILDITTKAGRPNIQWSKGKADALATVERWAR